MSDQDYKAALAKAQKDRAELVAHRDSLDRQIKSLGGIVYTLSNLLNVQVPDGLNADGSQSKRRKQSK